MGPNVQTPSTKHMEALIREAFDEAPGPDPFRLSQIEGHFVMRRPAPASRRAVSHLPWWAVGLLMAGFATAGWWAGSAWRQRTESIPVATTGTSTVPHHAQTESAEVQGEGEAPRSEADVPDGNARSPVIYQRETD
ncbi:MAG: hypothetical protein V3T38_04395 [Gammaproteobacteria bacterium]